MDSVTKQLLTQKQHIICEFATFFRMYVCLFVLLFSRRNRMLVNASRFPFDVLLLLLAPLFSTISLSHTHRRIAASLTHWRTVFIIIFNITCMCFYLLRFSIIIIITDMEMERNGRYEKVRFFFSRMRATIGQIIP